MPGLHYCTQCWLPALAASKRHLMAPCSRLRTLTLTACSSCRQSSQGVTAQISATI